MDAAQLLIGISSGISAVIVAFLGWVAVKLIENSTLIAAMAVRVENVSRDLGGLTKEFRAERFVARRERGAPDE